MKKTNLAFLLVSTLLLLCSASHANDLTLEQEWLIKLQIKELSDLYGITRDNDDAEGHAGTFAEDGVLVLYGNEYKGREVIAERVRSAGTTGLRMHVLSTSNIEVIDSHNARGVHYVTVYSTTKPENYDPNERTPVANFRTMGKYHDKYILTDQGWKFSERRLEAIFTGAE